ncbi:MAG: winged helix-turn-helix transcriptional regulator [Proteobacteria bacterium]|nr:winged helix-turn-helix transcriptional regulator [Pseudomonadota bacterium]
MDTRDYKTLQILEEIGNSSNHVSQRSLADKLDISLGLVNSFVKHLTAKGYFKAKSLPKKRVKYILTPEGAAEKTRLAYDYIRYTFDLYKSSYSRIHLMIRSLEEQDVRSVVFYGATSIAEMTYQEIAKTRIQLVAVVDDCRQGETLHGHQVICLDSLNRVSYDRLLVTACDNKQYSVEKILDMGVKRSTIVTIDSGY